MKVTCVALLLFAAAACGQSSTSPTPMTVTATISSGGFAPNPINISVGSTVTWMNNDTAAHAIVADAFSSGSIAPGAQYSYMFPSAGTFTYHDASNANMVGTVTVSGSSSSPY
jgi:plastocyanin